MANIFKAAAQTTNEIAKTTAAMATQAAASYTTTWDAIKDHNEYANEISNGTWGHATSNDRAQTANKAIISRIKTGWTKEDTTEETKMAG